MSLAELAIVFIAALAAGSINGAVGSGSLVTLPVLLWLGYDPATAITTNTIAMVFSAFGGVLAYRKELITQREFTRQLQWLSIVGGICGAILLITTTPGAIRVVVPILIVVALLLVIFQPRISAWVRSRNTPPREAEHAASVSTTATSDRVPLSLKVAIAGTAVYGGYFAAAQGVLLLGVLGASTGKPMREVNGVKNLLTMTVNVTAAVMFTVAYFTGHADVIWSAVAVMAAGALLGGYGGGRIAKAVPDVVLRGVIVVVALASLANEFLR